MEELNLNKMQKDMEPVDIEQGFVDPSIKKQNQLENIEEPPRDDKVVSLEEMQAMGVGQDITAFYRNEMQPALLNLHPKYQTFFEPGNKDYQRMLQGSIPIGYKDGVVPFSVRDLGDLSMEDKLFRIYNIQNGNDDSIQATMNREAYNNLFETDGIRYAFKNVKT